MWIRWNNKRVSLRNAGFPVMSVKEVYEDYTNKDFEYECQVIVENSDEDLIGKVNSGADFVRWVYGLGFGGWWRWLNIWMFTK